MRLAIQLDAVDTPLLEPDVFRTPNQQAFTLSHTPANGVLVYLNGLLMLADEDYTLTGRALTFTKQVIGDDPIIQVHFR